MKKTILLTLTTSLIALASCKKDHTCTCTTVVTSPGGSTTTVSDTLLSDMSKRKAKKTCTDWNSTKTVVSNTITIDCKLN
ncbi:MAG: hypothetical protein MI810_13270 [Flavobacteriales bacterium]|nr:hypothetical protein [Flavobacteriales bacterium]